MARRQVDRDSPEINIAEGRLLYAMRSIWDDLAEAREAKKSALLLGVTPPLVRGLNLHRGRSHRAATPADGTAVQPPITVDSKKAP